MRRHNGDAAGGGDDVGSRTGAAGGLVRRRTRHRGESLAALVLMTGVAVAWFAHTWEAPGLRLVGAGADGYGVLWCIAWVPFALGHGLNPLFSHYIHFPAGNNLMWGTSMPLVAALVSPITVTVGPVVAYNVVATAGPALAGWAGYLAFRRWTAPLPALAGALVFGFSPAMAAQSAQHPFLTFTVTAPLLLIVGDRLLVVQGRPAWRDGLWLGLLVWAQLLISEEVLAIEALLAVPAVVVLALGSRRAVPERMRHALSGLGVGAAVAACLSAWPLSVQFFGSQRLGQLHPAGVFVSDLWSFVTPNPVTQLSSRSIRTFSYQFTGNWTEWGSYLGVALLGFLVVAGVICRRRRVAWVAVAVVVVAGVLSLGGSLHVAGHDTHIPLPWALFGGLPVLKNLLPVRLSVIMFLGVGLLVALGLQELAARSFAPRSRRPPRRSRSAISRLGGYGLAAVALLSLIPIVPYMTTTAPSLDAAARRAACPARPGADVDLLPSDEEYVVAWQAESGFCFTIPSRSGLTGVRGGTSVLQEASGDASIGRPMPTLTPALVAQVRRELSARHPAAIIIGPNEPPARPDTEVRLSGWVTRLLGAPPAAEGDVLIWRHPHVADRGAPSR